jgi:hypothetical protein
MRSVLVLVVVASLVLPCAAQVKLIESTDKSVVLETGEYLLEYAPHEGDGKKAWVTITNKNNPEAAIGTKLANGYFLDVTDVGQNLAYKWDPPRKDYVTFRGLSYAETSEQITITLNCQRRWADLTGTIIAYKQHPGLIHWTVKAHAKADKAFNVAPEPECHFMVKGKDSKWNTSAHNSVRYMVQRGPASGIVYFRDVPMKSDVFYFQDYSSLNDLYRLTGFANPFEYPAEGSPGAVRMGKAESDFQMASSDGVNVSPPEPFDHTARPYRKFGYHRPKGFRVPKGTELAMVDTYLYLRPSGEKDNVLICRNFVESLGAVYKYIYKPPMVETDWAGQAVPQMCRDIMRSGNSSYHNGYFYPRAYVNYEHKDKQLWTVGNLLLPLIDYVKKYPQEKDAVELKERLEKTLPTFYDKKLNLISNGLPPLNPAGYNHHVWGIEAVTQVTEIARAGNKDAQKMIKGFRKNFLKLGKDLNYVFVENARFSDSDVKGHYLFDMGSSFAMTMLTLYELSGGSDTECLEAAKATVMTLEDRCMDLTWEMNFTARFAYVCQWLYEITGEKKHRELGWIPLANSLRWAWLWECDYGVGEHTTTFWGVSGTPSNPNSCEYESSVARRMIKEYVKLAGDYLSDDITLMLNDYWKRGMTQSRFAMPPYLVQAGAEKYVAKEGHTETNCGQVRYDQMLPLEDVNVGWGTDLTWFDNNGKSGVVGQEIYGAGGPIWYALWQDELEQPAKNIPARNIQDTAQTEDDTSIAAIGIGVSGLGAGLLLGLRRRRSVNRSISSKG